MDLMDNFRSVFTRSIYLAAMVFSLAHVFQTLAMSQISEGSFRVDFSGVPVLAGNGLAEAMVFFAVGWVGSYGPAYAASRYLGRARRHRLSAYALVGLLLGLAALPICASVAFFAPHLGLPSSYPARCVEFAYPMAIAGLVGGYAFWRFTRDVARNRQRLADHFV
jgi:hypothetical protein